MRQHVVSTVRRLRRLVLFVCIVTWAMALVATHIPAEEMPGLRVSDKALHMAGFFGLASLSWLTLVGYRVRREYRVPIVLLIVVIYAAVDESTQGLFHRSPDIMDWLFDVMGGFLAIGVWEAAVRLTRPRQPQPKASSPPSSYEQYPY